MAEGENCPNKERMTQLSKYFEFDPGNANLAKQAIEAAIDCQEWDSAYSILTKAIEYHPDSEIFTAHLGYVLLCKQDFGLAIEHLEKSLNFGQSSDHVRYNLAYCQFRTGNILDAIHILEGFFNESSTRDVSLLLARCYYHNGQIDDGIPIIYKLLETNNQDWEIIGLLALMLLDKGEYESSIEFASRSILAGNRTHEASLAIAGSHFAIGNYHEASEEYKLTVEAFPESGRGWSGKAQLEFRDFDFDNALISIDKAIEYMPDHIGTWHVKAWLHLLLKDLDKALQSFLSSLELDSSFGETHGGLASVYAMQDEIDKANRHLKIAQRLSPFGMAHNYAKMVLLNKDGKGEEAQSLLNKLMNSENRNLGIVPQDVVNERMAELYVQNDNSSIH